MFVQHFLNLAEVCTNLLVLIQAGEDNPLEFPFELDAILKKELAIRAVFQPKYGRLSVIGFRDDDEARRKIQGNFKTEEVCLFAS